MVGRPVRAVDGHLCLMPFRKPHELRCLDLEANRESQDGSDGGIELAPFDRADVIAVQSGSVTEGFLAEAAVGAHFSYRAPKRAVTRGLSVRRSHAR